MKVIDQAQGQDWAIYHGDCVEVAKGIPDDSLHYSIFSPPFASLYTYSNSDRDMGNSKDTDEFAAQFQFLVKELYRCMMPGRLVSFHCMNLPTSKVRDGYIGIKDFRGDLIRMFMGDAATLTPAVNLLRKYQSEALAKKDMQSVENLQFSIHTIEKEMQDRSPTGFIYHSEVVIWKDPVIAMQRTKALGLLHKQVCKDSAMSRQGIPDYLVTMRKPGDNPERCEGPFTDFVGEDAPRKDGTVKDSINIWQRYASPVWMDIDPGDTLQFRSARDNNDERHICPLQLQVIDRALQLWTNPGDVVLSPFAGIGSEGYSSLRMGRKFVGIELKESYYKAAVNNLTNAETSKQGQLAFA